MYLTVCMCNPARNETVASTSAGVVSQSVSFDVVFLGAFNLEKGTWGVVGLRQHLAILDDGRTSATHF